MKKIILLAVDGDTTWMLYNHLVREGITLHYVVLEQPVSKKRLVQRRIKKLGILKVFGQLIFQVGISPLLKRLASSRIQEILSIHQCDTHAPASAPIKTVASVNDASLIQWLQQENPDLILVNGTRILSKAILQCTSAPFINTHLGITPAYRGVHGGYWSLYENDAEHFGTTIHLVDTGIDTGGILQQVTTRPTKQDNFCSYPYLQMAIALPHIVHIIQEHNLQSVSPKSTAASRLYYHPTWWQYLQGRMRGVR